MSEEKKASKGVLIFCFAVFIIMAYFIGNHDGKTNGKIELCESMGGFLGMNKITEEITCYNGSIQDITTTPQFGEDIQWG